MAVEHLLNGLEYRFSVTDQPGLTGHINGLPPARTLQGKRHATDGDRFGAGSAERPLPRTHTLSLRDMLRGSRGIHSSTSGLSVWGQASHARYEDKHDGIAVEGEVTTGVLGMDRDNGETLLGLALSYSDGEGDWSGETSAGELTSTLVTLLPYVRHHLTPRLQIWGAAGYGRGQLEQTSTARTKQDIKQTSAAGGMRGTLLERPEEEGGLKMALTSEVILARMETQAEADIPAMTANTRRLRLGLEWSWQRPQADGGHLIPELQLGMRYDGGNAQDGYGLELGGGLRREWPARGLTLDVRGRYLLEHENRQRREWGISASLRYDSQPASKHGLSVSLNPQYGNAPASGGLNRLLSDSLSDIADNDTTPPRPPVARWNLKGEWGFALEDGATAIGYADLSESSSARRLTLGWRRLSAPQHSDTELHFSLSRREEDNDPTRHSIAAEWLLRW